MTKIDLSNESNSEELQYTARSQNEQEGNIFATGRLTHLAREDQVEITFNKNMVKKLLNPASKQPNYELMNKSVSQHSMKNRRRLAKPAASLEKTEEEPAESTSAKKLQNTPSIERKVKRAKSISSNYLTLKLLNKKEFHEKKLEAQRQFRAKFSRKLEHLTPVFDITKETEYKDYIGFYFRDYYKALDRQSK